ncbi:MAG: hypothetical protein O2897_02720 [bacterium]|nr:hypothetical protein [bacterium]
MSNFKLLPAAFLVLLSLPTIVMAEIPSTLNIDIEQKVEAKLNTKSKYPTSIMSRPFTMPQNSFEAKINFKAGSHSDPSSLYSINKLSLDYGIINDFQIGLSWDGLETNNKFNKLNADKPLSLNAGYFLFAIPHAAAMATLSVPFHFDNEVVKTTSFAMPTAVTVVKNKLSFLFFYYDSVKVYWRTIPNSNPLKVKNQYTVDFTLPVKLGYQATDSLNIALSTNIATLNTDGKHDHLGKTIPLHLDLTYAVNSFIDVTGKLSLENAYDAPNTFSFTAGVAYRFGMIDG